MDREEFNKKLEDAAALHNIAIIQKRIGKPENYRNSIESYQKALDLYFECHDFYNLICESGDDYRGMINSHGSNGSESPTSSAAVNLELKIAQTLQSVAKLHIKLNEDTFAIKTHEDAITILLEEKARQEQADMEMKNISIDSEKAAHGHPTTPELMPKKFTTSASKTPQSVAVNLFGSGPQSNEFSQFNITRLTHHERTRLVAMSLAALAQIYFNREVRSKRQKEGYDLREEEDALQYYQESLNVLRAVTAENPVSKTGIPAFSNDKDSPSADNNINQYFSSDENQPPSVSSSYTIDLRYDVVYVLMSMASLFQMRSLSAEVVDVYEQTRDLRLLLNCSPRDQEMIESLLAIAYERNGQGEMALTCYQHVLKIRKGLFGADSLEVGNLYVSMGNLHRKMGDLGQSLGWNKRAVAIYENLSNGGTRQLRGERKNGKDTSKMNVFRHLIGSLQNQGALYVQIREINMAIASYLTVIEKQVMFCGEDHPDVANTLNILGDLYMRIEEFSEARASFNRALELYRKYNTSDDDPEMASTLQSLCEIEVLTGVNNKTKKKPKAKPTKRHPPRAPKSRQKVTKPFPRPSVAEQLLEENVYCAVVETNSSFVEDDDAVSQITFLSNPPDQVVRSDATTTASVSAKTYQTFEKNLDDWSPAELVFRAVEKMATATEEFFIGPPTTQAPSSNRRGGNLSEILVRNAPARNSTNEFLQNRNLENVEEGYEVREFQPRDLSPQIAMGKQRPEEKNHIHTRNLSEPIYPSNGQDKASTMSTQKTPELQTILPSLSMSRSLDTELEDDSITAGTEITSLVGSLAGTKFLGESDSITIGTNGSTLFGTNFVGSIKSDVDGVDNTRIRNLSVHRTSASDNRAEVKKCAPNNTSESLPIDQMLAQMNVMTCEMEGDAKPFEELLKGEKTKEKKTKSSMKQDKAFEKLSACLDTLIELKETHGPEHVKVILTMSKLAQLYLESGNTKGISKYNEVLDLQRKKYGDRSAQVSSTHVKLGEYWTSSGEIDKAIESFSISKEIDTYLYGKNHPSIAQHLNRMGLAELERSDFDMAMDYLQEALKIQKMNLGPNETNPDVSQTMVNMGSVYYKERNSLQKNRNSNDGYSNFIESGMLGKIAFAHSERGEYMMAMNFYGEELEILKAKGNSILAIAAIGTSLGKLNVKIGRYNQAMNHHLQVLKAFEHCAGNNKLDIIHTNGDIGVVEIYLGNFKKAGTILEGVCTQQREILGIEHKRVAKTIYYLAVVKRNQFKLDRAKELLNQALRIQLSTQGQYNPDTIETQMEIAKVDLDLELFDEALKGFENVLRAQKEIFGNEHPDIALTLHFLGICFSHSGDEKSLPSFERCFRIQRKFFKVETPVVASTMDQIGQAFLKKGKYEKASRAFQDALRIYREVGENYYGVAFAQYSMGRLYFLKNRYIESLRCFKESMSIAVRTFGLKHPFIADIHVAVGNLNTSKCHFEEAMKEFKLALEIYNKCEIPEKYSKVIECQKSIARVKHEEVLCV